MTTTARASFGALLRHHRLTAGLTQEELAERAGLSARGIQSQERGDRTTPRAETVRLLVDALELSAQARSDLIAAAHPELAAAPATPATAPRSLPPEPVTPLIGREHEVATACDLLRGAKTRLLTLTGPGGVGKTRLAQSIANEVATDYADGVGWVDLAALREPTLVANAIARALGLSESGERPLPEMLARAVAHQHLLLIVDNCEHLLQAMPLLGELLAVGPRLSVLATSRSRLRLRGERELTIGPLALPAVEIPATPPPAGLAGVAAVRLFVARAAEVRPGFTLTSENAAAVAAICRQVEGLPLALELAAARIKILPPAALGTRLAQRLPLLTGGARDAPERQQTMRQAIAWSHDLLGVAEQILYRRLAVFAGSFTLDAVERVTGSQGDRVAGRTDPQSPGHPVTLAPAIDRLAALVDQSLVRQEEPAGDAAEARFAMLETVREYAGECLAASGEEDAIRQAHAAYFLALAERAESELTGPAAAEWLSQLEAEHDNLRAALAWSIGSGRSETAVRLGAALGRFWRMRGHPREGLSWLERVMAVSTDDATTARGQVLETAGRLAHDLGQSASAETLSAAALEVWRTLEDQRGQARVLDDLGNVAHDRGDFTRAVALHEEALVLAREVGDPWGTARALNNLAMSALYQSQDERAWGLYQEALTVLRAMGNAYGVNVVLTNLGIVAIRRGELGHAAAISQECLAGCRELGDEQGVGSALINLAEVALLQGNLTAAGERFEEARQILQGLGDDRSTAEAYYGLGSLAVAEEEDAHAAELFATSLALAAGVDDKLKVAENLEGLAGVAARREQPEHAAQILGAAAALRERIEAPVASHRRASLADITAATRAALDAATFATAWETGQAWPLEHAIGEARDLARSLADLTA